MLPESLDHSPYTAQTIADVARHLNSKLHEQAKKILSHIKTPIGTQI